MLCQNVLLSVLVQLLIVKSIKCQSAPEWKTPVSKSFTLDTSATDACTPHSNILDSILYAESSGETVYYRKVSETPDDGAFVLGQDFGSDMILTCNKQNVKSFSYEVVIGAYYEPRTTGNEATITVTITVQGLRQPTKPTISIPKGDMHILETARPGDVVTGLEATDGDSNSSNLTFTMDNSPNSTLELFEIVGNELKIRNNVPEEYFDAEKTDAKSVYMIELKVENNVGSAMLNAKIFVDDVNDNAPEFFGPSEATVSVNHSADPVLIVLKLNVTDKDSTSPNNKVTLNLSGAEEFKLNGSAIEVATGVKLNVTVYNLTVTATDNALTNPLSTSKQFTINVIDGKGPVGTADKKSGVMTNHILALCAFCVITIVRL